MGKQVKPKFDPNAAYTPVSATTPGEPAEITLTPQQEKPKFDPKKPYEPVKKKEPTTSVPDSENGTTPPGSPDGSTPSVSVTPPTEKPSAREKLKSRVQNLSDLYKGRVTEELNPFIEAQQQQYDSIVTTRQNELQALINSGKLNVEQANSQLQEFSNTKKAEFDQKIKAEQTAVTSKYGSEISKWLDLYNRQYEREDFAENKVRNPFTSFRRSAWTTLSKDLPSAAYAARALGQSAKGKVDQQIMNAFEKAGIPQADPSTAEGLFDRALKFITGATDEQIAKSSEVRTISIDEATKKLVLDDLRQATEFSNASAEAKKYLVNSLDKVAPGDWLDLLNYVASAAGQGAGQIPASLGTRGTTSLIQEMGNIYLDSVHRIAQESGLSVEQVIKQGKDDVVYPILFGFGAGLLDAYGANRIGNAFTKEQVMKSFRNRALEVAKTTGFEGLTEGAQGILEEVGINKSMGKTWVETFLSIDPEVIKESALQGGIAGMFLGGAGQAFQAGVRAMKPAVKPKTEPPISPIDAAVKRGATVSFQAEKPTETVVEEAKIKVDPKNPESIQQAAEIIQQSFNENSSNVQQPSQPEGLQGSTAETGVSSPPVSLSSAVEEGTGIAEKGSSQVTDEKGTYDFTGVRERLSKGEEAAPATLETLRGQILNSPEDLKWDGKKVTILTEKGAEMLRQYQELKQQPPEATAGAQPTPQTDEQVQTEGQQGEVRLPEVEPNRQTDEQTIATEQLVAQPPDQSQQEPVGSGQGGTAVRNDIATPKAEIPSKDQADTTESPVAREGSSTQQSSSPVAQVEKTSTGDSGSYVFSRPIQPVPESQSEAATVQDVGGPPAAPPTTTVSGQSTPPVPGERATIVKLQEESNLSEPLKEGIEDFKHYEVKKQALSRQRAQNYIKRKGEDQALQDAISGMYARPQEERIALLSELSSVFSEKFQSAERTTNDEQAELYYGKFMTAMNTLSNLVTDTAQALAYMNLTGKIFETKTGAVRFAKNQIEQSREAAMTSYQEMKLTAEQIIEAFDKLPREEFLKSKQVQDIIGRLRTESPKRSRVRQANEKLSSAAEKLKEVWERSKRVGIIYDPKSQAKQDVELTRALIDYIRAFIEKIAAESGEFVRNIGDQVTKGTKDFIKEVGIDVKDEDLSDLITPEVEAFRRSGRYTPQITPAERDRAVKAIKGLLLPRDVTSGTIVRPDKPAIAEFYDRLVNRVLTAEKKKATPQNRVDAIEEVLKNIDKYTDVLQGVRNEMQAEGIDTSDIDSVFQLPFFEKALRKNQAVAEAQKLIDDHYSNVQRVKDDLAKQFQDEYGLTEKDATDLERALDKVFDEWMAREKQKVVNRFKPKTRKPDKRRTEFYDKVIKLSNVGAVTDQQLEDTIAEIFGLPRMTPEIVAQVESMVEEINKAPEGRFKNIAITKMTDYIAKQQRFNISDYMLASFRAGIFSGIDTQALNLMGNFSNVLELGFMMGLSNPRTAWRFIASVRNPTSLSRAGLEALEIIRTGFDPRVAGDMRRRALEQRERTVFGLAPGLKGWKQALDPLLEQQKKYVFRALSAGDILFSQGINDALQNELYNRRAKEMGLRGEERVAYVNEQMGFTPEKMRSALDQAAQEAGNGQIPDDARLIALRAKEIIEQQRDPDIVSKAREYAQAQILTNTPGGYIGIVTSGINAMIQRVPVLAGVLPVVNFAGNAMQRAVQYVPPAALARGAAHYLGRISSGESLSSIVRDDLQRLKSGDLEQEMRLRRFLVGTVSLALMGVLLDEDDEGNNWISEALGKTLKIHGFGPGTKINRQKNYQLQESGWKAYSIQVGDTFIPYKNYPGLNILLATYGEYADAKRYGKLEKKDALNRLAFAMGNSFAVIAEMGFLTSLNDLLEGVLSGDVNKFARITTRTIGGFITPKFQRNVINLFDDRVFSGRDIQEISMRSIPILPNVAGEPIVNALGEDVRVNWWERIELWSEQGRSSYSQIWETNAAKNYYFPVPSRGSLEKTFDRPITTAEYNKFFRLRGAEIIKEFRPELSELSSEDYERRMDKIVEIAKYRALVEMGVMETDLMKEIRFQLDDIMEVKRQSQQLKKDIK